MANIKFTDTLECTATHGKLAKAAQIFDDAYGDGMNQSEINAALASLAQSGGLYMAIDNTKLTYEALTNLASVQKGDVYVITDSFVWGTTGKTYPPYTNVLVMSTADNAAKKEKNILPLSAEFPFTLVSMQAQNQDEFIDEITRSENGAGSIYIIPTDIELKLWYNAGNSYEAAKQFDGTYLRGSMFLLLSDGVIADDGTNEGNIIPLSPTKEKLMLGGASLNYKGFIAFDDIPDTNHKVGDLLIVTDDFDIDGIDYGYNTTIFFKKDYSTGNSFDAKEYIVPLSTAKSEETVDTSALEARIAKLEAALKLA